MASMASVRGSPCGSASIMISDVNSLPRVSSYFISSQRISICGATGETRFRLRGAKRSTRTIALPDSGMKSVYGRPSRRMRISAK